VTEACADQHNASRERFSRQKRHPVQLHCYWPLTCKDPTHTETPQQNSADILQCVESVNSGAPGELRGGYRYRFKDTGGSRDTQDTHGTRGRTKAYGPHRRTSQPSKPTNNTQPARQRDDRSRGRLTIEPLQARSRPLPAADSEEATPSEPDPASNRSQSASPRLLESGRRNEGARGRRVAASSAAGAPDTGTRYTTSPPRCRVCPTPFYLKSSQVTTCRIPKVNLKRKKSQTFGDSEFSRKVCHMVPRARAVAIFVAIF